MDRSDEIRSRISRAYGRGGNSASRGETPASVQDTPAEELVREHAEMVRRVARRYVRASGGAVELDDLYSVGIIGLLQAQQTYDPAGGREFGVFAEFRVRGAILDELRARDPMSQPLRRKARQLQKTIHELENELGRPPEEEEIAERHGITLDELHTLRRQVQERRMVQFENEQIDDLRGLIARSSASHSQLRIALTQALSRLPERQQQLIALYYFQDMGLREIGEILGVSEARVCQLHKKAVTELRGVLD